MAEFKLSILICSTRERSKSFSEVIKRLGVIPHTIRTTESLNETIFYGDISNEVQVISIIDNKQISVGAKRQRLLELSKAEWIDFFDDDDEPYNGYSDKIMYGINNYPDIDCMGIHGDMTTNGINPKTWIHSMAFKEWRGDGRKRLESGFDYERNIIHFNPVKRIKALESGFKDIRFGEDKDYSDRLNKLLTKEYFIPEPLFHYKFTTKETHNKKYGIQ